MPPRTPDQIDALVGQWATQYPSIDTDTMARAARLLEVARTMERRIAAYAATVGVDLAEGDILFTLRRSGPPFRLTPSDISAALLVSSGTLTNRLDRLERKGFLRRVPHPTDRRSTTVELAPQAVEALDAAIFTHVENERAMLSGLSEREQQQLDRLLRKLLLHLRETEARGTTRGA
jgi:DNA-binding MarR family transcriptional regulator